MAETEDFLDDVPDAGIARTPRGPQPSGPVRFSPWQVVALIAITAIIAGTLGYKLGEGGGAHEPGAEALASSAPGTAAATPTPVPTSTTVEVASPTPAITAPDATKTAFPAQEYLDLLDTLEVKGRAPMTGYSRDLFGQAWLDVDRNGCDTRNDILRRDLGDITLKPGTNDCVVLSGELDDPYTGNLIDFERGASTSSEVQIDHVVALADAWAKGAQQWPASEREAFANDPRNLLAVDGPTNQEKGAGDAATWLPPNRAYWCDYAAAIVLVKSEYEVWTTAAEHARLKNLLEDCVAVPDLAS